MRKLLLIALLVAHAGATRAEAGAPPVPAGKPAKAQKAGAAKGAKAQPKPDAKATQPPEGKPKASGTPAEVPCEPVKPCPIE